MEVGGKVEMNGRDERRRLKTRRETKGQFEGDENLIKLGN